MDGRGCCFLDGAGDETGAEEGLGRSEAARGGADAGGGGNVGARPEKETH